ncbi:MAG TPA: hypothetical protein VE988_22420 [Gemmataceae bacterium]|nr:hypothetical protein [Gemmataceae bacterium]
MNPAESISGLYLRLNGFFLLPEFTVFRGGSHQHIDLLGLRPKSGTEVAFNKDEELVDLPIDTLLFDSINHVTNNKSTEILLGAVAEVKANQTLEEPSPNFHWVTPFFGAVDAIVRINFTDKFTDVFVDSDTQGNFVVVGMRHALVWIRGRIKTMQTLLKLNKGESWTLSEGYLANILLLMKYDGYLDN